MFTLPLGIFFAGLILDFLIALGPVVEAWNLYRNSVGSDIRPLLGHLARLGLSILAIPVFWAIVVLIPRVTGLRVSEDLVYAVILVVVSAIIHLMQASSYRAHLRGLKYGGKKDSDSE